MSKKQRGPSPARSSVKESHAGPAKATAKGIVVPKASTLSKELGRTPKTITPYDPRPAAAIKILDCLDDLDPTKKIPFKVLFLQKILSSERLTEVFLSKLLPTLGQPEVLAHLQQTFLSGAAPGTPAPPNAATAILEALVLNRAQRVAPQSLAPLPPEAPVNGNGHAEPVEEEPEKPVEKE